MKEKVKIRKIKKHLKQLLKEQTSFNIADNDPDTSCAGRGICCEDNKTKKISHANFTLLQTNEVICSCPEGYRRRNCPQT